MEEIVKDLRDKGYSYEMSYNSKRVGSETIRFMDIKIYYIDDIIYESEGEVSVGTLSDDIFIRESVGHSRNNKINEILWKR